MQNFLRVHENDNVIVALQTISQGTEIVLEDGCVVAAREVIPAGHKMAITDIAEDTSVIKYGYRIGNAKEDIKAGDWIHTHNVKTALGDLLEYTYEPVLTEESARTEEPTFIEEQKTDDRKNVDVTFMGFNRADGKVGVRNEIWIIPTVGCLNNVASAIALVTSTWFPEKKLRHWLAAMLQDVFRDNEFLLIFNYYWCFVVRL